MRIAILAHEGFPDRAKTALGILRYSDHEVAAVLDRELRGQRVSEFVDGVPDAPIEGRLADVDGPLDALVIGVAPIGGGFDESWRQDVRAALERGCDVISGLHYFLEDDAEFRSLAEENGCDLWDVRRPPDDLTVSEGVADEVDAEVVLTVGTDCSAGKMTTTMELRAAAREAGYDATVVPTGQTGIVIEDWGIPVDRVVSDFAAGAVERMVVEAAEDAEVVFVEGQGSVVHPAYSGVTTSILHGAMPDSLVLCHVHGREAIHGYEDTALPPIPDYVDLYESLAAPVRETEVAAGALNTSDAADDAAARRAVEEYADAVGAPATDVLRFGADEILEAVL